jgi:hypothetical protein
MAKLDYGKTNLVGAPFKDYVNDQIGIRQSKLGQSNKGNQEIVWENGKTAYIALASSVDIRNTLNPIPPATTNVPTQAQVEPTLEENIKNTENAYNNDGERRVKNVLELPGDPTNWFGNELAKQYILFGGTSNANLNISSDSATGDLTKANAGDYRFGVTNNTSEFNNFAYGLGGTEMGINAMPGITGFNVKSRNMGSLREVTVNIRANNENQFKIIDNLYCRIGYTMFLEWGNSQYFNNSGGYISVNDDNAPSLIPTFLTKKYGLNDVSCPSKFLEYIEKNRERSYGNYDAFFGRVKNFSWEFNQAGYYEITLSLISWGDIIESLGVDGQYGGQPVSYEEGGPNPQANNNSALSSFLSIAAQPQGTTTTTLNQTAGQAGGSQNTITSNEWDVFKSTLQSRFNSSYKSTANSIVTTPITSQSQSADDTAPSIDYTRLETSVGKIISAHAIFGNDHYYYIRFGDILDFIKDRLLIYHPECDNEPIVNIDTEDTNYCYYSGVNVSADPSKVMVRAELPFDVPTLKILASADTKIVDKNGDGKDDTNEADWPYDVNFSSVFNLTQAKIERFVQNITNGTSNIQVGKIMNIYFEYQFLLDTIQQLRDQKTKKLPLFNFLNNLCETASSCLGGVNRLAIRLKDDNILQIYDQNPIYGTQDSPFSSNIINLYGFNTTTPAEIRSTGISSGGMEEFEMIVRPSYQVGSFVTDFNIRTELTNEFSTTVAIGAQAQGNVIGEDSTGLSKWNYGLVDRYYPSKIDSLQKANKEDLPTTEKRINRLLDQLKFLWLGYADGNYTTPRPQTTVNLTTPSFTFFGKTYYFPNFQTTRYAEFVKLQQDYLQELIKYKMELDNANRDTKYGTNQIGMLPINISVTMDGLSGIRIYDRLAIDTRFIPNYYPQTLVWIIKGVSHEIRNNKWYTKLETIAVPKLPNEFNLKEFTSSNLEEIANIPQSGPSTQTSTGGNGASSYTNSPLAKKLASLGRRNGYLAYSDMSFLGTSGGEITVNQQGGVVRSTTKLSSSSNLKLNTWNVPQPTTTWAKSWWLAKPAAIKLLDLTRMAAKGGINLTITSTYRSYAYQANTSKLAGGASQGNSPHGWGGAIDIAELYGAVNGSTDPTVNAQVRANNAVYLWLAENGPKVGWINPRRLADGAGVDECWHWEWWGTANLDLIK